MYGRPELEAAREPLDRFHYVRSWVEVSVSLAPVLASEARTRPVNFVKSPSLATRDEELMGSGTASSCWLRRRWQTTGEGHAARSGATCLKGQSAGSAVASYLANRGSDSTNGACRHLSRGVRDQQACAAPR